MEGLFYGTEIYYKDKPKNVKNADKDYPLNSSQFSHAEKKLLVAYTKWGLHLLNRNIPYTLLKSENYFNSTLVS